MCGCRVLAGVEWTYVALDACKPVDGDSEVIPRADTFVGVVIDSGMYALSDNCHDGGGEVAGISGCSYLVEDDTQLFALCAESKHGFDEIVAECGVEPCCANDECATAELLHTEFACKLGGTVDGIRAGCGVLGVWYVGLPVKDVVGGDLYNPSSALVNGSGEVGWCHSVQGCGFFVIILCLVYSGVGGAVDDAVDGVFCHELFNSELVCDVEFCDVGIIICVFGVLLL